MSQIVSGTPHKSQDRSVAEGKGGNYNKKILLFPGEGGSQNLK